MITAEVWLVALRGFDDNDKPSIEIEISSAVDASALPEEATALGFLCSLMATRRPRMKSLSVAACLEAPPS